MKTTLIILHGWGASAESFSKVKELLQQKGFSVFVLDLPGFGRGKPLQKAWSVNDYANWVREWIENNILSLKNLLEDEAVKDTADNALATRDCKLVLFGHSFGGRIAIKVAFRSAYDKDFSKQLSEKLVGLILCDAAGITPRPKIKIAFFKLLTQIGKFIFSLPLLKPFRHLARKIEYFFAGSRDYYYLQDEVMRETFKKVINEDLTKYLNQIKVPTLIIWGEKDKLTPISDAYIMHNKIVGSKLKILKGLGHSPHLDNPEVLSLLITNFLKDIENNT